MNEKNTSCLLIPNSSLIAMSGGVDSSVSAYLMAQKYKTCVGATMLLLNQQSSLENINDAKKICAVLGIKHEVLNFADDFEKCVIKKFVSVYESGGTPNPCVDCNKNLKFGKFLNHAKNSGLEKIATGHYAKIQRDNSGRYLLFKADDLSRDQSYVLYMLTQENLASVEFPLGCMKKTEVRELARELNFITAKKSDSQDICFIPDGNYGAFIEIFTGKKYPSGNFIDASGKILGVHKGIIHYTTGQRRGLGVAAKSRLYVSKIDSVTNNITLVPEDEAGLYCDKIKISGANLIAFDNLPENFCAKVKTRYRQKEIPAIINQINDDELIIEFKEKIKTPARGQAAVIYDGDLVIGGGTIFEVGVRR
ncbi:MAG: tRNA 2-thiouridine(34) synthase MnmA [Synergistales bacterium]|nr:tRNA 2-thiouridine(34) synthase MnmA [Synergistales bacterium]MDY6402314.1 tRNA 2-thiouridine(34) synthase MnmA [Synergistales bacterium]MDY6405119.1 tRNA 2-thiouridine(34) synthase MnmA [Synergistales bacterium]MDY6409861.1 tRNA 2-thiouridine(34) synthase MnmA [Synergistales bacterium]MDY6414429.1 tRNA 2-thiouridine(34) synthase MnmA [Synergistales bacterium]